MENSGEMGCKGQRPGRELTRLTCSTDVLASGLALQNRTTFFSSFSFWCTTEGRAGGKREDRCRWHWDKEEIQLNPAEH